MWHPRVWPGRGGGAGDREDSGELGNSVPPLLLLSAAPLRLDSEAKSVYTGFLALKMGMRCCPCLFYRDREAERFMACALTLNRWFCRTGSDCYADVWSAVILVVFIG